MTARRLRRLVAASLPIAVPVVMTAVFDVAGRRLGPRRGYLAGFVTYWAGGAVLAAVLIGPRRAIELVAGPEHTRRRHGPLEAALLAWPAVGAVTTRMLPELRGARARDVATICAIAEVNAPIEELLWRGVFVELWPGDPVLGWAWPALGFGAWHLAPQAIHRSEMGPGRYLAAATALGLSWGAVAARTGSLRWTTLSHVIADASGIRNARLFLGE
jgi:hypothetical protein